MKLFILSLCAVLFIACSSAGPFRTNPPGSHRRAAEKLRTEKNYIEAIQEYEKHIAERLSDKGRPEEENPSFYYIFIGDLQLELGKPDDALEAYMKAHEDNVMVEFIIDRVRRISSHYEEKDELDKSLHILNAYRDLDPLLFDWDINRIHRKLVAKEQESSEF